VFEFFSALLHLYKTRNSGLGQEFGLFRRY